MSLKDIASQLGISAGTVSYILNGKAKEKRISQELEEKVRRLAAETGYQPDPIAKSLRTRKTNTVCLMVEDIADNFFAAVAGHIETLAYEKGYKILYASTKNDTARTKELIRTFRMNNVDGYIIVPPPGIENEILALLDSHHPVILFDRRFDSIPTGYVGMDNFQSSADAVTHLFSHDYRNIALVTIDSGQSQMRDRLAGYQSAIQANGGREIIRAFQYASPVDRDYVEGIGRFFGEQPEIDAVLFSTNYLALSGIEALNNLGRKIAQDIGVVAFDDTSVFKIYQPSITAVTQPIDAMSKELVDMLTDSLQSNGSYTPRQVVVPASLSIRKSSEKRLSRL
jgi:LacI family transcriptional regulator